MRILLVTSRYPWPPRRGDQLRACQMIELLGREHAVTLLCPRPAPAQPEPPPGCGCAVVTYRAAPAVVRWARAIALALVGGQPLQSGLFGSKDLRRRLRDLAPRADLGILQLVRLAGHRRDFGATPVVVDLIDDLALNFARRAAVDRAWLRPFLLWEARLLLRAELRLAAGAAAVLLVCDRDRGELARQLPAGDRPRLATVTLVAEGALPASGAIEGGARLLLEEKAIGSDKAVEPAGGEPTGRGVPGVPGRDGSGEGAGAGDVGDGIVDAAATPGTDAATAGDVADGIAGEATAVFTGNLGYFVNADAICWWLREVWPELAARRPRLRLVVAGDRPGGVVRRAVARAAAGTGGRVVLRAAVPSLRQVLAGAAAALAPMRCGSGVPVKVLDAWDAGVPVVASAWAAAGTSAVVGDDLLVAGSPREWVDAVSRLLDDPVTRARLAANGRRRLGDYSREEVGRQLAVVLRGVRLADGSRVAGS